MPSLILTIISFSLLIIILSFVPFLQYRQQHVLGLITPLTPSSSSNASKTTSSNFSTYQNSTIGMKIQYPSDWQKNVNDSTVTFITSPGNNTLKFFAKLNVTSLPTVPGITLKELGDGAVSDYKAGLTSFRLESYTNTTLAGSPAVKIVYMYTDQKAVTLRATDIGMIKNDKLYIIQFAIENTKYESYLPILEKMIYSFGIT